jgi:hypothetical protein
VFDELELLRVDEGLRALLNHYAEAGAVDRDAWQDRLMALAGVEARELVRLHGLLIGFGWLEQNTGHTPVVRPGAVPGCYRTTAAGLRALRAARAEVAQDEPETTAAAEEAATGPREGRKGRAARRRKPESGAGVSAGGALGEPAPVAGEG